MIIVVVVRRTNINSVLDGAIYGGLSAAGFMFTEDILYYLRGDQRERRTFCGWSLCAA